MPHTKSGKCIMTLIQQAYKEKPKADSFNTTNAP